MRMPSGAQRFVQQQLAQQSPPPDLPTATVTAVTAGGSTDGQALVTVTYKGGPLRLPYLSSYTPVVGHVVVVVSVGGILTIFGRPIGFPPTS